MVSVNLEKCLEAVKKIPAFPEAVTGAVKRLAKEEVAIAQRHFSPERQESVKTLLPAVKKAFSYLPIFPKGRALLFGEGRVSKCLEKIHKALSSGLSVPAGRDAEDSTGVASLREQSHLRKDRHEFSVDRQTFSAFFGSRVEKMRAPFAQALNMLTNFLQGKRDGAFIAERASALQAAKNSESEFVTYAKRVESEEAQRVFVTENARLLHQQVEGLDENSAPLLHFGSIGYAKNSTADLFQSINGADKASKEQKQFLEGDLHALAHNLTEKFLDPIKHDTERPRLQLERLAQNLQGRMPGFLEGVPSDTRDLFLNVLRKRLFDRPAPDGVAKLCDTFCDQFMKNGLEETLEEYIHATLSNTREFVDGHFNDFRYFLSDNLNAPLKEMIAESSLHLESDKRFWMEINKQADGTYTLRLYTNDRDGMTHPLNHLESGVHYPLVFSGIAAEKMSDEFFEQLIAFQTYALWDKERTITLDDLTAYMTLHLEKAPDLSATLPLAAVDGDNAIDWLKNYVHHHCLENEEDFSLLFEYQMPLEFLQNVWKGIQENPKQLKESSLRRELKGVIEQLTTAGLKLHEKGKISDEELTALFGTILDVNEAIKTEKKAQSEPYEVHRSNIIPEDLQHVFAYLMDKTGLSANSLEWLRSLLTNTLGQDFGNDFDALVGEVLFDFNRTEGDKKEYDSSYSYAAWRKTFAGLNDPVNCADLAFMTVFKTAAGIASVLSYSQKAYLFQWLVNTCLSSLTGTISFKMALLIVSFGPIACKELLPKELHEPLLAAYDLFFEVYTYFRNRIILTALRAAFHGVLALRLHPKLSEEGLTEAKQLLRTGISHVSHGVELSYDLDANSTNEQFTLSLPTARALHAGNQTAPATWSLPRPQKVDPTAENLVEHLEEIEREITLLEEAELYERGVQTRRREALTYLHGAIYQLPIPGSREGTIWSQIAHSHKALNRIEKLHTRFTHLVNSQTHTQEGAAENVISLYTLFAISTQLAKNCSDTGLDQDSTFNTDHFGYWLSSPALKIASLPLLARAKEVAQFFGWEMGKEFTKKSGKSLFSFLNKAEELPYVKRNIESFQTFADPGKVIHTADLVAMNPTLAEMQELTEKFAKKPKDAALQALNPALATLDRDAVENRRLLLERSVIDQSHGYDEQTRLLPLGLSLLQKMQESAIAYTHFDNSQQLTQDRSKKVDVYPFTMALEKVQATGNELHDQIRGDRKKMVVDWLARGVKGAARYFGTAYEITDSSSPKTGLLDTKTGLANRFAQSRLAGGSFELQSAYESREGNEIFGLQAAEMLTSSKTLSQAEIMQDDTSLDSLTREEKHLLEMAGRHSSDQIVRCMDFFTHARGRLSQQRYRILFEILMNDDAAIKAQLEDRPEMAAVIGKFFGDAIKHFIENDDYATALFLAKTGFDHLVHSCFYIENAKEHFPNFAEIIRQQILPNFRAQTAPKSLGSMEDGFVGSLLYLTSLYSNLEPNREEKQAMLDIARLLFARSSMDWKEMESEASAKSLRTLYLWEPLIHEAIENDGEFRNRLLNTLVEDRGGQVTVGEWGGAFPRFTKGDLEVSLIPQENANGSTSLPSVKAKITRWIGEDLGSYREIADNHFEFPEIGITAKRLDENSWNITRKIEGKNFRLITDARELPAFVSEDLNSALWIEQGSRKPVIYQMKNGEIITTHHTKVVTGSLDNPTLEIVKTSPLPLDQAKYSGLEPLHRFQSLKNIRVETEGEKVKKINFPKVGLSFEVDENERAVSTDGSTPGFSIAKQQKHSTLVPFTNTLLLENERGEQKVHIMGRDFKELLATYLFNVPDNISYSPIMIPPAFLETIKNLLEMGKIREVKDRKMYTYDLNEKGDLTSRDPRSLAYLGLFYVANGKLDQLFPLVEQLNLLGRTTSFPEELFPLLDSLVLLLGLRRGKKATELLLKITAIREENSVLHQEKIPAPNGSSRLLWLIIQSTYRDYLKNKESSLNEFEELYILNSISRQNRQFSKTNSALNAELEKFGLGNFVEGMAMLPSLARRYQVLRAQFDQESTWRLKAEKLIVNTLFGEGNPALSGPDGKVAPISTFRKISRISHQLFRFAKQNKKDYTNISKNLEAAIKYDSNMLGSEDVAYFEALSLSPSSFTNSFLKENFLILYRLARNEIPQGWAGNAEREQLFANKVADLHRAMSLTVGRFKNPESQAIWHVLQTAIEQTPLYSLLGSSFAYLVSLKKKPIATGTKTTVALYNSFATTALLDKLKEMPLPAATRDFITALKQAPLPSPAEALLHSLNDRALRPATNAFLRSLRETRPSQATLAFIESLEEVPLPTSTRISLPTAAELERLHGRSSLQFNLKLQEIGETTQAHLKEQVTKNVIHTVTGYKVLDSKTDLAKAAGVAALGATFLGLKGYYQISSHILMLKAQLVTHFAITRPIAVLNAVKDNVAEPTPLLPTTQLPEEMIFQMDQREHAISGLLKEISDEYLVEESLPAAAEEPVESFAEEALDSEKSVREEFERLNLSLSKFYSEPQPDGVRFSLKKEKKYAVDLMHSLFTLQDEVTDHLAKEREAIIEFVNHVHIDSLDPIQKLVADSQNKKQERDLTFEEISTFFAKEDEAKLLEISHMQKEDLSEMKRRLYLYHLSASRWQFLFDRIDELPENPSAEQIDHIGQELNRRRVYQFDNSNERVVRGMILFESNGHILLRKPQTVQLEKMLKSDHHNIVTGLKPGSGKTSVIMVQAAKNKADGKQLVLNIWPKETAEDNTRITAERSKEIYSQRASAFTITRSSFQTVENLTAFYQNLRRALISREQINLTQESMQALELNAIEVGLKGEKDKFSIYRRILAFIYENGLKNYDEAHAAFNPNRKLIYPIGSPSTLPTKEVELINEILLMLVQTPEFSKHLTVKEAMPEGLKSKVYEDNVLPLLAKIVAEREGWDLSVLKREELANYLSEEVKEIPAFVLQSAYRKEFEIAKDTITSILPHSLSKIIHVDFDRSKEGRGEYARPSKGNGNTLEDTNHGRARVALVNSGLLYLHDRLSESQIENLISTWREQVRTRVQTYGVLPENTPEARLFKECCEDSFHLFTFSDEERAVVFEKIRASDRATLYYITHKVAPQITFYKKSIAHNPINFGSMTKRSLGYTGTPNNKGSYPNQTKVLHDLKTDGESLDALARAAEQPGSIQVLEANEPQALLEEALKISRKDQTIRIYTDRGAHANGLADRNVVQELLKSAKGGVVFYENGACKIWEKGAKEPIPIDQSTIPLGDRLTYFSQPQTFAADVKQAPGTKAILTISEETTLSELTQAFWRNRNGKNLFVMTKKVRDRMTKNQIPTIREIIAYTKNNEATENPQDNFHADISKMHNVLRSRILNKIRNAFTDREAMGILNQFKDVFVSHDESDSSKFSGQIRTAIAPESLFNELRHQVLRDTKEASLFVENEFFSIKTELEQIGKDTYPKEIYSYHDRKGRVLAHLGDLGSVVEVQEQVHEQQEQEQRVEVHINQMQKRVEIPREKQPHFPWPKWATPSSVESWFKELEAPEFGAPPVPKSFGSKIIGMIADHPLPAIYSLSDVLTKSGNHILKSMAENLSSCIYSTNNMTPLGSSGRDEVQPFGPYQIPPQELLLIQEEEKAPRMLLLDQDEAQFWREQIKASQETTVKIGIVNITSGATLAGNGQYDDPRIKNALIQLRFLRADTQYRPDDLVYLEQWLGTNRIEKKRYLDFYHGFHGKAPIEGSQLEAAFQRARERAPAVRV